MDALLELRVVDGPVAVACWALAAAGIGYLAWALVARRPRRRGAAFLAGAALAAPALTLLVHRFLVDVASVFPSDLPPEVLFFTGLGLFGVLLATACLVRSGRSARQWGRRLLAVASALAVALLAAQQINAYFGLNLTVGDVTGSSLSRIEALEPALERGGAPTVPLAAWTPPEELAPTGELRRVQLPHAASGFAAREAFVYLPPAYSAPTRPELPVLVLMAGQPGGPADWLTGGQLRGRMDRFAREHGGVAPVVVVVDPIGKPSANTLCMDTKLGQAETYLVDDVAPWIKEHLAVSTDARSWAVGGFSFGATCSVQLLAKHPELFGSALAFAAEKEPSLAKERSKTIQGAFDGDTAAFEAQLPAHFFAQGGHDGQFLFLAAGGRDPDFVSQAQVIAGQARGGGVDVHEEVVDGEGHSWEMIGKAMPLGLERLADRWGLP